MGLIGGGGRGGEEEEEKGGGELMASDEDFGYFLQFFHTNGFLYLAR